MADRPILSMPPPEKVEPPRAGFPQETIPAVPADRQGERIGPKFQRLSQVLEDPQALAELRDDPSSIVPERALVFEVASNMADFYRAARGVPGLDFLGEDEGDAAPDDVFHELDKDGQAREDKRVPRRFYFTIPDKAALDQLVSLWKLYQEGKPLGYGRTAWAGVFGHLADLRPWGPQDRLTKEAIDDWSIQLQDQPDQPVRLEVEFWFRSDEQIRQASEARFTEALAELEGTLIHRALIEEIRYHAVLLEIAPSVVRKLIDGQDVQLLMLDEIMVLRPQSLVVDPALGEPADMSANEREPGETNVAEPIAALLDGAPMTQHELLANRLIIDDPDNFSDEYGASTEQRHGTAMASLILHGDLNEPELGTVGRQLYVRPVMHSNHQGIDGRYEAMPDDRLGIDLIWQAFIRMFDGEGGEEASAPTIRVVNISLGDSNRQFSGVMSPWAKLIDFLSWKYNVLIVVSAGNITDGLALEGCDTWGEYESASAEDRQKILLRSILNERAKRRLLAPSEALNALTVGSAHSDSVNTGLGPVMAVDPYQSNELPNLSSAVGLGFKRSVKPEILMPGGAEFIRAYTNQSPVMIKPVIPSGRYFGIGVASPSDAGELDRKHNLSGTSVSAALATHSAIQVFESLEKLPDEPAYPAIDFEFTPVLLKALIVHSSRWSNTADLEMLTEIINENGKVHWEHEREEISRLLGYGCPDVSRVIDCAENRATLLGWNSIGSRETDRFSVPLPNELEGVHGYRAVSVTIAWITPLTHSHRSYRLAKFKVDPGGDSAFSLGVKNSKAQPSHNAVGRGTVYHRRWEGEEAAAFVDDGNLIIDVTCSPAAGELDESIKYAIVATLEVAQDLQVPVYQRILERLRAAVAVRA